MIRQPLGRSNEERPLRTPYVHKLHPCCCIPQFEAFVINFAVVAERPLSIMPGSRHLIWLLKLQPLFFSAYSSI